VYINRHFVIALCAADVERVADYILNGDGRHQTFSRLAQLGDKFGHRMVGTEALENAIGEWRL